MENTSQQARQKGVAGKSAGRGWAAAGIICGLLTLVWSPIVFALLGVGLGFVGRLRGAEVLGKVAIGISLSLLALIFVINAVLGGLGALV